MTASTLTTISGVRFAACIEYDGALFSGWQSQVGVATVQDAVERALSRVADHKVCVVAAGRTDAGVHSTGQTIHFDSLAARTCDAWLRGGNTGLPDGIAIRWVRSVSAEFHARFGARRRHYRYILLNQSVKPALFLHQVSWEYRPLNVSRMREALGHLVGMHDFSAYRASACQSKNPVKTLHRLGLSSRGGWVWLDLEADGFLHHMVRNIAGVLLAIGRCEREPDWALSVLQSRDRRKGGITAPPGGLYLTRVEYDADFDLPEPAQPPAFW